MATKQKEVKEMNVYQKIQEVRSELVKLNLKKTGKNTYSNFNYYELGDFLPSLNKLMGEIGLMTRFTMPDPRAVLEVFNAVKPEEKIVFFIPTAEVEIGKTKDGTGGAQPIQNLGGQITYLRRYLLMIAFEIVESDAVDEKKQDFKYKLDTKSVAKIKKAKDLQELGEIAKSLKELKGPKYIKSLVECYTQKKEELENETI